MQVNVPVAGHYAPAMDTGTVLGVRVALELRILKS